jgi:hypothetical protein
MNIIIIKEIKIMNLIKKNNITFIKLIKVKFINKDKEMKLVRIFFIKINFFFFYKSSH